MTGQVVVVMDVTDGSLKMIEVRSLEITSPSLFSMALSGHVYLVGSPNGQGHLKVRGLAVHTFRLVMIYICYEIVEGIHYITCR